MLTSLLIRRSAFFTGTDMIGSCPGEVKTWLE